MIAYRDAVRPVVTELELLRLHNLCRQRETEDLLIGAGELEQGIVDAVSPAYDSWGRLQARLRELVVCAARAHLHARSSMPADRALDCVAALLAAVRRHRLPSTIGIKAPEGYMHYALDPASYAVSARRYAAEVGLARARLAGVVGVRSIGTSLSAVVAATLSSTRTATVRPRGVPGARQVVTDAKLQARIARWLASGAELLIVDEGPGATGETFACVAAWLRSLGAEADRLVLFSHHEAGLSLAPQSRRDWFAGMRKQVPPGDGDRGHQVAAALGLELADDLSAGRWRCVVPGGARLPACPHHERRKFRARGKSGALMLLRYAGRGRWGRATIARAERLAERGVGLRVRGEAAGFVAVPWLKGRPVRPSECRERAFGESLIAYLSARATLFATGETADDTPVIEMLAENARGALGENPPGLSSAIARLERLPPRPAAVADARLLRYEWLKTEAGYIKVDALDHGDGLRPPGPIDPAWDLAGAAIELSLDDPMMEALFERCAMVSRRAVGELRAAALAYRAPYAACGLGEMVLSARESASTSDRCRFERHAARYLRALCRELSRLHAKEP